MESLHTILSDKHVIKRPSVAEHDLRDDFQLARLLATSLIFSLKNDDFDYGIELFLRAGCTRFNCHTAIVSRPISTKVHEVLEVVSKFSDYYCGQHLAIGDVRPESPAHSRPWFVAESAAALEGFVLPRPVQNLQIGGCLGTVFQIHNNEAFVSFLRGYSVQSVELRDQQMLEILSEGISAMLEHQGQQKHHRLASKALMTSGSIKSLEEYRAQARLPEIQGIAGKVIEVLQERIGTGSLGINDIADQLMLSKRTLQRRLQQNELSFADLRDQVRYNQSIDLLTRQRYSIDSISAALDFSDRTSFTNAFKRWTGLSPSTFRKLFRDYI